MKSYWKFISVRHKTKGYTKFSELQVFEHLSRLSFFILYYPLVIFFMLDKYLCCLVSYFLANQMYSIV